MSLFQEQPEDDSTTNCMKSSQSACTSHINAHQAHPIKLKVKKPIIIFVKSKYDQSNTPPLITEGVDPITGKYVRYDCGLFNQFCDTPRYDLEEGDANGNFMHSVDNDMNFGECGDKNCGDHKDRREEYKINKSKKNGDGDLEKSDFMELLDVPDDEFQNASRIRLTPLPVRFKPRTQQQHQSLRQRRRIFVEKELDASILVKEPTSFENILTLEDLDDRGIPPTKTSETGLQMNLRPSQPMNKAEDWRSRKLNYTLNQTELANYNGSGGMKKSCVGLNRSKASLQNIKAASGDKSIHDLDHFRSMSSPPGKLCRNKDY